MIEGMEKQIEQLDKDGAYVCAPKESALAKAHLRFAKLEISQGMSSRARKHFEIAKINVELAAKKSPPEQCAAPAPEPKCADADADGICDDADIDGDGILDGIDQCLLFPEDKDEYLDDDGCPDLDNDADGLSDKEDSCINEPEDPDGFEDQDGCPDLDNDQDTVPDADDECPNISGDPQAKGCLKYDGVEITDTHIRINQTIHFEFNKAVIRKTSYWILDQVVKVLGDYPKFTVSVEGHTDSKGSDKYNMKLSAARAKAVMDYLIQHGIGASRLTSKGFGETKPIDTNATKEGRAVNRRVEFVRTDVAQKQ